MTKKQYRTPKVSVGTVKKSIAAIASRWLLRNAATVLPARIARRLSHPAQHGSLGNIEAEHFQLSVNARRAPGRILGDHTEDEFPQSRQTHFLPTRFDPRKPRPVELESCPMPANDGLRLDEGQCPLPSRPQLPQDYPEQLVGYSKSRLRALCFKRQAVAEVQGFP